MNGENSPEKVVLDFINQRELVKKEIINRLALGSNNSTSHHNSNRCKPNLILKQKDPNQFPKSYTQYYTYTISGGFLGLGKQSIKIYFNNSDNSILYPEKVVQILENEIIPVLGGLKKLLPDIYLTSDMKVFKDDYMAKEIGIPVSYSSIGKLFLGVECNSKEYLSKVKESIFRYIIHSICVFTEKQAQYAGWSGSTNKYYDGLTQGISGLLKQNIINGIRGCARYNPMFFEELGVLYFVNPDILSKKFPEYYEVFKRLIKMESPSASQYSVTNNRPSIQQKIYKEEYTQLRPMVDAITPYDIVNDSTINIFHNAGEIGKVFFDKRMVIFKSQGEVCNAIGEQIGCIEANGDIRSNVFRWKGSIDKDGKIRNVLGEEIGHIEKNGEIRDNLCRLVGLIIKRKD